MNTDVKSEDTKITDTRYHRQSVCWRETIK